MPTPTSNNTAAKEQRTCFQRGKETTKLLKFLKSSPPFGEYTNPKKVKLQSSTGRKISASKIDVRTEGDL